MSTMSTMSNLDELDDGVFGSQIGRAWFEDWSGESWPGDLSPSSMKLWEERGIRALQAARATLTGEGAPR